MLTNKFHMSFIFHSNDEMDVVTFDAVRIAEKQYFWKEN